MPEAARRLGAGHGQELLVPIDIPPAKRGGLPQTQPGVGQKAHHVGAVAGLPRAGLGHGASHRLKFLGGGQAEALGLELGPGDRRGGVAVGRAFITGEAEHALERLEALVERRGGHALAGGPGVGGDKPGTLAQGARGPRLAVLGGDPADVAPGKVGPGLPNCLEGDDPAGLGGRCQRRVGCRLRLVGGHETADGEVLAALGLGGGEGARGAQGALEVGQAQLGDGQGGCLEGLPIFLVAGADPSVVNPTLPVTHEIGHVRSFPLLLRFSRFHLESVEEQCRKSEFR